jgi:hypothetical protein
MDKAVKILVNWKKNISEAAQDLYGSQERSFTTEYVIRGVWRKKKSFTMVFEMLLCSECYENDYT